MSTGLRAFPEVEHVVERESIDDYAEMSGDYNPLHMEPDFAASTPFGSVVAHGPIALQTLFEAIAGWLGGESLPPGVRIDVRYRGPVRVGDTVTCRAEEILDHAGDLVVLARSLNQEGGEVFQALVVVPRSSVPR